MGIYGIHFERTQTWWELSRAWITYLSRCQFLLQQGLSVADLCYLAPEASPQVFRPSGKDDDSHVTELAGYKRDGCTPEAFLNRMSVKDGSLTLPDGMSYRALVLPRVPSMTPRLLRKIRMLVEGGATVIGAPPVRSPGLTDYPSCDQQVKRLADELWGDRSPAAEIAERRLGKGRILAGAGISPSQDQNAGGLYPDEHIIRQVLDRIGVAPDFEADRDLRFAHRRDRAVDVYFVANPQPATVEATCRFRMTGKLPELWDPVTGETRPALAFRQENGRTLVPLELPPSGSLFVLFRQPAEKLRSEGRNSPEPHVVQEVNGPWTVQFDPRWGGPGAVKFPALVDWTSRQERRDQVLFRHGDLQDVPHPGVPGAHLDAAALPRSGPREITGPGERQRHRPGHCLDPSFPRRDHPGPPRGHEQPGGARREPLAQPHDRRPAPAAGEAIHLQHLEPVPEGLSPARVRPARAGRGPGR